MIVEGTVARYGQRVRITVQLVRARDDRNLLSETYERELSDVLLMRSELANAVASQIQMKLVEQQQIKPVRRQKVDPKAYDAFLKGNFFLQQGIRGISKSIDYFHQALSVDPSMADAHVGLAEALCFAGIFDFRPSAETYLEARTEALRALEIDDTSAGAHNVLADVKKGYDWELTAAETEYKQFSSNEPQPPVDASLVCRVFLTRLGSLAGPMKSPTRRSHWIPSHPLAITIVRCSSFALGSSTKQSRLTGWLSILTRLS